MGSRSEKNGSDDGIVNRHMGLRSVQREINTISITRVLGSRSDQRASYTGIVEVRVVSKIIAV